MSNFTVENGKANGNGKRREVQQWLNLTIEVPTKDGIKTKKLGVMGVGIGEENLGSRYFLEMVKRGRIEEALEQVNIIVTPNDGGDEDEFIID